MVDRQNSRRMERQQNVYAGSWMSDGNRWNNQVTFLSRAKKSATWDGRTTVQKDEVKFHESSA